MGIENYRGVPPKESQENIVQTAGEAGKEYSGGNGPEQLEKELREGGKVEGGEQKESVVPSGEEVRGGEQEAIDTGESSRIEKSTAGIWRCPV